MNVIDQDADGGAVFVLSELYESAEEMWHANPRARLIVAGDTVLTLHTETGRLVAPPKCAVWVLPGTLHRVSSTVGVALRSLYADADVDVVPSGCCVVAVDSLADVLLTEAATFGAGYAPDGPQARIVRVLLDHLPHLAVVPLSLNWPQDPRTQHIADALVADPADTGVLDDFSSAAGVTARTAARLFVKETGLTFGQWRQQLRLLIALEQLGSGESVTQVALRVGYHDVSSFIAVFRQALGETPARYFR